MSINAKISEKEQKFWVGLSTFLKFGAKRLTFLKNYFPDMETAFNAPFSELKKAGILESIALEFIEHRKNINLDKEIEKLEKENIKILLMEDENYPVLLKQMPDAPQILYYRGEFDFNKYNTLAVVGSRKYSVYGQRAAEYIIKNCVEANLAIASGLALGIDAIAHSSAIKNQGKTIAVLGSGVNDSSIFPTNNRFLAKEILAAGGALISEFPHGTPALKHHFPQRNRIIAGLALGVLVVEAAEKSGALITAKHALEYNREVFSVPGSIFNDNAKGVNNLIKSGAKLTESINDILEEVGLTKNEMQDKKNIELRPPEQKIANLIGAKAMHVNQIAKSLKLDTGTINATLLTMELKGAISNLGGGNYVLL